jgi:RNA polymerase sigma-70 factor (ECF subfamily)
MVGVIPASAADGRSGDRADADAPRRALADALARLSAEHLAVVRRSYYHGWTTTQIAADLDIADGTVKSRLHYALSALRMLLQEMGVTR